MPFTVTVAPDGVRFEIKDGETVLQAALRAELPVPARCRHGDCGQCEARIVSGAVHSNGQHQVYGPEGMARLCRLRALGDLVVDWSGMQHNQVRTVSARVVGLDSLEDGVRRVYLRQVDGVRLRGEAGQHLDVIDATGRRTHLALACPPDQEDCLEVHLPPDPSGRSLLPEAQTALWRLQGPFGGFDLSNDERRQLWIVRGTGFASAKAVIEQAMRYHDDRPAMLIRVTHGQERNYLEHLPHLWAAERPGFVYRAAGERELEKCLAELDAELPHLTVCLAGGPGPWREAVRALLRARHRRPARVAMEPVPAAPSLAVAS